MFILFNVNHILFNIKLISQATTRDDGVAFS